VPAKVSDEGDGPLFFGIAEISGHAPRVVDPEVDLENAIHLQVGDVVVVLLGESALGAAALIDDRAEGAVLGRECAALRVTANDYLLPSWLYAWTKSRHFDEQVRRHASGGSMSRLSVRALEEFALPLPPRCHQERLEAEMYRLDEALRSTAGLIRNLEELRGAEIDLAVARAL
jgi:hypothetical protein